MPEEIGKGIEINVDQELQEPERVVLANILNAVSMKNQFSLIRKLLERARYDVNLRHTLNIFEVNNLNVEGLVVATLFDPTFLTPNAPALIQYKGNKLIYVTIEGVPKKSSVLYSPLPNLSYIAVSKFVGKMLTKAGVMVKAAFHHCIDVQETMAALKLREQVRQRIETSFPGKVTFLFVGRNDPRKGIEKMIQANEILKSKGISNYVILVVSEPTLKDTLTDDRFVFVNPFGSLRHEQVLSMMSAVDFVVFPSKSEGFGLPVLESMSVGTPVVHTWMPPLTEFSSEEFNFVYDFDTVQAVDTKMSQFYVMHEYSAEYLADSMEAAIDTIVNNRETYEEYRVKALKHSLDWEYRRIYTHMLDFAGFEVDIDAEKEGAKADIDKLNEMLGGVL